ncbi:MAG: nicotinate phosphoribosyltransferase [Thermoprotei archaeon]|jgi:nicotinate phosphoribosyltransferase
MFFIPTEKELKSGDVSDLYFKVTEEVLKRAGKNPYVTMEVFTKALPEPYNFGVLSGLDDVTELLTDVPVDVYALEEGEIFFPQEPVLVIKGKYLDFAIYEPEILGFLCEASGSASRAARMRLAVGPEKLLFAFGTRRSHPASALAKEKAALEGGFNGTSNVLAAKLLGIKPVGTIPHAMVLAFSTKEHPFNQEEAFRAYDAYAPSDSPRTILIDTFFTPRAEALIAARALGNHLQGVRIDSGELDKEADEVRWELKQMGLDVKVTLSGGLNEYRLEELANHADAFGVGNAVTDAPTIDFGMKISEVDGFPISKTGHMSGAKKVYRDYEKWFDYVVPESKEFSIGTPILKPLILGGKPVREKKSIEEIRRRNIERLFSMPEALKDLHNRIPPRVKFVI